MTLFDLKYIIPQKGAYIVGGSVRDLLLGISPVDIDIAVSEDPEKYARAMAASASGHLVKMGRMPQIVYRVVIAGRIYDVTALNGGSIAADLALRDFTINAIAYELESGQIIDPFCGQTDLAQKKIRMLSPQAFQKDPLRLLRAYRLGAAFGFQIEAQTEAAIRVHAARITSVAGERIATELFKTLGTAGSYPYIKGLAQSGVLEAVIPELSKTKGCRQNRHHVFDVFEHTLNAYGHLEEILGCLADLFPAYSEQIASGLTHEPRAVLKCAVLLHDIGKPATQHIDAEGKRHFYGHAGTGAEMSGRIAARLKLANRITNLLQFLVRNHQHPFFLFQAYTLKRLTPKAVARFFMKCRERTPALLLHFLADQQAKQNEGLKADSPNLKFVQNMMSEYYSRYQPLHAKPPLISGHDLIKQFGLTPSPHFKIILRQVEAAYLAGSIQTREEGLRFVAQLLQAERGDDIAASEA